MNKAIKLTSSLCNAAFTVPKFIQPAAKLFLYTRMAALTSYLRPGGGGGGVLPYISYIGMCHLNKKARHWDFRHLPVLHDIYII